jgi:hypothetical protein
MKKNMYVFALALSLLSVSSSVVLAEQAIESQIDGDFEGFQGETVVKLTNGQIWQQADYSYNYNYSFMPKVIIYETSSGIKMKVDGAGNAVTVIRLK